MADLFKTNLVVVAAQLPPDFLGDPQEFFSAMIERMEIQSPVGTQFFVVSDSEPDGNQGPWLRTSGTPGQWWVFSVEEGRYVPLDISASLKLFVIGPDNPGTPGSGDPLLWLRTFSTRGIGWFAWDGTQWRAVADVPPSGATDTRPTDPVDLEQFFDTDINVLLHWERGGWRTVSGSPGDVKHVVFSTLADALKYNPGWDYIGRDDEALRGRVIGIATQDGGATPDAVFSVGTGVTPHGAGDDAGNEVHILIDAELVQHSHLIGHATALNADNNAQFHRVDNAEIITIPPVVPPNYFQINGDGGTNGTHNGSAGDGAAGTMLITSRQLTLANAAAYTGVAVAHNNIQPTRYLWTLAKL